LRRPVSSDGRACLPTRPNRTSWRRYRKRRRSRLIVEQVSLRSFRSYPRLDLLLEGGLVLAVGPNGAGKTNLLEALHLGTQGFSPRTRTDAQLIRFGENAARVTVRGRRGSSPLELEVTLRNGEGKRAKLNGAQLRASEQLRGEVATLVFTPDRLAVVKGAPSARRAYFDRTLGRIAPARAPLPTEYGAAIAQRNAALRRIAGGYSSRDALEPWTRRVAELGAELVQARCDLLVALAPGFAERADELGLPAARIEYDAEPPTVDALSSRLERDLERTSTGIGPHLDDFALRSEGRDLRSFGSQGEQRTCVLALLLAEADLLEERRGVRPLLLLDDVLSELDAERRRVLVGRVAGRGQTLVTSTSAAALPAEPAQLLHVSPGVVAAA
jgi:DNA replication and repair protein RecF